MSLFRPDMYKKNIFEIDYKKLKKDGIKCLIFDLDNTLGLIEHEKCPEETRKLIKELEKDFLIFISSNNTQQRIDPYLEDLGIKGVAWSLKPSTRSLRKIRKNEKLKKDYYNVINKIENKIDRFDYKFEKAKRQNNKDKSDCYWNLIINFKELLESEE